MTRSTTRVRHCLMMLALAYEITHCWKSSALAQDAAPATPPSVQNPILEQAIHDYIIAHPEVIIESLQRAKAKAERRESALIKSRITAFRKQLVDDPNAPVLGNPKGDVTLVEFFDYRYPYCRQVEPWLQTLMQQDHGVRLVQKEFPILGPASVYAAQLALAAWKQGRHAQFHSAMMAKRGNIDDAVILQVAQSAGLDMDRIKIDMNSVDVVSEIQQSMEIAKSLGLSGTPGFIVGTELVPGATDLATFHAMVDDARRGRQN